MLPTLIIVIQLFFPAVALCPNPKFKGTLHPNIKIQSLSTHPNADGVLDATLPVGQLVFIFQICPMILDVMLTEVPTTFCLVVYFACNADSVYAMLGLVISILSPLCSFRWLP